MIWNTFIVRKFLVSCIFIYENVQYFFIYFLFFELKRNLTVGSGSAGGSLRCITLYENRLKSALQSSLEYATRTKMATDLNDSKICRLCSVDFDNGITIFDAENSSSSLELIINRYLPLKVSQKFFYEMKI